MGYKTILLEEILEMMNPLTSIQNAWYNLVSVQLAMFYGQRLLDGALNHFAER